MHEYDYTSWNGLSKSTIHNVWLFQRLVSEFLKTPTLSNFLAASIVSSKKQTC